jgi:hypothetical protein
MKLNLCLISAIVGPALAFPGMSNLMAELAGRQATAATLAPEMIGDLIQGANRPVGNGVKNCLLGTTSCQNLKPKVNISIGSRSNTTDNCVVLFCATSGYTCLFEGQMLCLELRPEGSC